MPTLLIRVKGFTTVRAFSTRKELEKWAANFMAVCGEDFVIPLSGALYKSESVQLLMG